MRKTKRRSQISIETDDLLVIRTTAAVVRAWCPRCSRVVNTVPVDAVAARVKSDTVHTIKASNGVLMICLDSVEGRFGRPGEA